VISGVAAGTVVEATANSSGTPTVSADLLAMDVDNPKDLFQAVAAGAATANGFGSYEVTAAGVWTYSVNNSNATVNDLNTGQSLTDSFTVFSQDGTSRVVNITIQGATDVTNVAPTNITLHAAIVGDSLPASPGSIATLTTTDADLGDTHSYAIVGSPGIFGISGNSLNITSGLNNNSINTVQIRTTDSAGATYTESFNVIVGSGSSNTLPGSGALATDDVVYGLNNADIIFGGSGDDTLFGQDGDDTLNGGAGSDTLYGGARNDTLDGGAGNDMFVFNTALSATTNVDTITDFVSGTDKIYLENTGGGLFNALPIGVLAPGALDIVGTGPAANANTRISYDPTTGALSYDSDGTGGAPAVQFATLGTTTHPATLSTTDFLVI
jgi:VCBS repeat-containing protein